MRNIQGARIKLPASPQAAYEQGLLDVISIRCLNHRDIPTQNHNAEETSECAICVQQGAHCTSCDDYHCNGHGITCQHQDQAGNTDCRSQALLCAHHGGHDACAVREMELKQLLLAAGNAMDELTGWFKSGGAPFHYPDYAIKRCELLATDIEKLFR